MVFSAVGPRQQMDWQFTAMAAARLPQLQAKTKTMDPWKPRVQWNLWTEERSRAKRNETKARGIKLSAQARTYGMRAYTWLLRSTCIRALVMDTLAQVQVCTG